MTTATFLADLPPLPAARFANVFCSQCGREFGPGDQGFSSCRDHGAIDGAYYWSVEETEAARSFANDPEDVARALVEGVRDDTARAIATALQLLKEGRHDEAESAARRAESGLIQEYLEA
jgi:hypothetical protein